MYGDTFRSPELRHEVPLGVPDPFLYVELAGVKHIVIGSMEIPRLAALGLFELHPEEEYGRDDLIAQGKSYGELKRIIPLRAAKALGITRAAVPESFPVWLADRLREQGVEANVAASTLDASLGNPGQATAWIADGTLALREECAADLAALAAGRAQASTIAERWAQDRADSRLWFAAVLAREEADALARGRRGRFGLTGRAEIPKLVAWFGRANRARGLLSTPLRGELVLLDLLRSWPAGERVSRRA